MNKTLILMALLTVATQAFGGKQVNFLAYNTTSYGFPNHGRVWFDIKDCNWFGDCHNYLTESLTIRDDEDNFMNSVRSVFIGWDGTVYTKEEHYPTRTEVAFFAIGKAPPVTEPFINNDCRIDAEFFPYMKVWADYGHRPFFPSQMIYEVYIKYLELPEPSFTVKTGTVVDTSGIEVEALVDSSYFEGCDGKFFAERWTFKY